MRSVDVDEIAEELYGLAPEEFTAARDAAAKDVDDLDVRKAVKALRKPTAAAHEVNVLVRRRTDDVDALLGLGEEMRAAMGGDAAEVRRLTEQRRELIDGLIDPGLPTSVQQDVTATLEAATADPDLAAAVRSGRLVKPLRYAGFGTMPDLGDAVATPLRTGKKSTSAGKPVAKKQGAAAKQPAAKARTAAKKQSAADPRPELVAARAHVLELAGAADDAQRRYELAAKTAAEARRILEQAEAERTEAHKAARAAHAEAEKARRELGRLERS